MLKLDKYSNCSQRWNPNVITAAYKCLRWIWIFLIAGLLLTTHEVHATVGFYSEFVDVYSLAIQTNGKIIVAGQAKGGDVLNRNFLVRLNVDGSLDLDFDLNTLQPVENLALQPDDKIIVVVRNYDDPDELIRLNPDGSVDNNFNSEPRLSIIRVIAVLSDGKILIGGDANTVNAQHQNTIYRLNADGSIDKTFKAVTGKGIVLNDRSSIESIVLQPDEKILIGGRFNILNGQPRAHIARLHNDGSLDMTFNPEMNYPDAIHDVRCMAIQPDGKILVSGWYRPKKYNYMRRLNTDGSMDSTYDPFFNQYGEAFSIDIQPGREILVGGRMFELPEDRGFNNIIRMEPDGSEDVAFKTSTGHVVNKVVVQADSKILVGGKLHILVTDPNIIYMIDGNGYKEVFGLARLNADGSVDETFKPWTDNLIKSLASPNSKHY